MRRIRAGLYELVDDQGVVWTIEERRDTYGGGNGWAWFPSADNGDALDPLPTLREAKAAVLA